MYFPRHQIPFFRGYAHCVNTEGTASKQFPRATDQHPTGKEGLPSSTPHKQNISQQFPSQETSNLLHSPQKRSDIANEAQ